MTTYAFNIELTQVSCGECGGAYAIDTRYHQQKQQKGGCWTCPYCACSWGFPSDGSELARLKRKLEYQEAEAVRARAAQQRERKTREATERRLSATKGVVTRIKNRVKNGVCPCCNRTFQDLQRHMENKHPDYNEPE